MRLLDARGLHAKPRFPSWSPFLVTGGEQEQGTRIWNLPARIPIANDFPQVSRITRSGRPRFDWHVGADEPARNGVGGAVGLDAEKIARPGCGSRFGRAEVLGLCVEDNFSSDHGRPL